MAILSKLGPDYSVFFFTFHATKLTARAWKISKLVKFMESLTQEQDKLVMMVYCTKRFITITMFIAQKGL